MTIEIVIASLPDREKVVAELWIEDKQIAEISNENDELIVEIYSTTGQDSVMIPFKDLVQALEEAKKSLVE